MAQLPHASLGGWRKWTYIEECRDLDMSMPALNAAILVEKGLLPENLPPVFSSLEVAFAMSALEGHYQLDRSNKGELCVYNASKRGGTRRIFSVPHPVFVFEEGLFFDKHSAAVDAVIAKSTGSFSKPIIDEEAPRYIRVTPHSNLPTIRLKQLSRFRYCIVTDVSRCYYSIYTHTLPWAIHTKDLAKKDRKEDSTNIFGNRLDFLLRQSQDGQTIGIAVGPDISRLVAEVLLCAVDDKFQQLSTKHLPTYVRHVDDYWIGGNSLEECEHHLKNLRMALKFYQLDINEAKTRALSTKLVFSESWPTELLSKLTSLLTPFSGMDTGATVTLFGQIIDAASSSNDDAIIRSAIKMIDKNKAWARHWDVLEHFLVQCAVQFPHSFDYVARVIVWRLRVKKSVEKALWIDVANNLALQSASLGRDSETVWAIWMLKELGCTLEQRVTDAILQGCNGLVLAYLAHFPFHGLTYDKGLIPKLDKLIEGDFYAGSFWPLSLELNFLGHPLPGAATIPRTILTSLHDAKVSLIDWDAAPRIFEKVDPTDDGGDPDHAIEDYGFDYEDEDENEKEDEDEKSPTPPWESLPLDPFKAASTGAAKGPPKFDRSRLSKLLKDL